MSVPGAMEALQSLGAAALSAGVPAITLYLIEVTRQITGEWVEQWVSQTQAV